MNYKQIPVNAPKCPVDSYSKDGAMRIVNPADPVYAPNTYGGPAADPVRVTNDNTRAVDGDMVRREGDTSFLSPGPVHFYEKKSA